MNYSPKTYVLYSQPFLDTYNQCYKNIVTINLLPEGPLRPFVQKVAFPSLSTFKQFSSPCNPTQTCGLALKSIHNNAIMYGSRFGGCNSNRCGAFMSVNEIPDLFAFLLSNGYKIDTSLTKMINTSQVQFKPNNENEIICFFSYLL